MAKSFYIPINSGSLAHYFGRAIILPAKYFSNKPEDIQNTFDDSILLSNGKWVKNSDCTIEVVLTDSETKELDKISDNFLLSKTPIPVSRIKSICFLEKKQLETTIWNINSGAAFIPESLVSVEMESNIDFIAAHELKSSNENKGTNDVSEKIKRFDIILGGFAFMRLGGKQFMNYSPNYFSTFSYFNKLVYEQTILAAKEKGFKFSNKYTGLFIKSDSEWTKWLEYIYQNLEPQDIERLAEKEGEKIEKRLGLLKIDTINPNSHLYELAILATYGDRKNKSTDNLVTDLLNGTIEESKREDVSIVFGLNNGYAKLHNKYKGETKECLVKFTLESKLDYYIIESVYQFAFNGIKENTSFDYIDSWCPSIKKGVNKKGYETYKILDTVIIAKKKQTPLEVFLENYSADIYSTIIKSVNQWLPPFVKSDDKEAIQYFEKQLRSVFTTSIEALQKKIVEECETNLLEQNSEIIESKNGEINQLRNETSNLIEENERLKKENKLLLENSSKMVQEQEKGSDNKEIKQDNNDKVSLIQEPEIAFDSDNNSSVNLTELKKVGKKKGISDTDIKKKKRSK